MTVYTPPVRRVNSGRGHKYVDANGLRVPGVTTIIGDGVPKPALIAWAADSTAEAAVNQWDTLADLPPAARLKELKAIRYADRDTAANRGTQVHALADRLVRGEQVPIPDGLEGYVESYVRFLDEHDIEAKLIERVVLSHRHGYAGTLDLVTEDARLLDIKTGRSGVYGEAALQLAAYRYADVWMDGEQEQPMPEIGWTGVVHVRADGYDLIPVEAGPAQHRTFLYVQQVARFAGESRDLVGSAVSPPTTSLWRLTRAENPS